MPARYVHLNNSDVEDAILKMHGIKEKEDQELPALPKRCPTCDVPNSPESEMCSRCGKPLDLKKVVELEEKVNEQNFNTNKLAGKILIQMLIIGQIPKISKEELTSLKNYLLL